MSSLPVQVYFLQHNSSSPVKSKAQIFFDTVSLSALSPKELPSYIMVNTGLSLWRCYREGANKRYFSCSKKSHFDSKAQPSRELIPSLCLSHVLTPTAFSWDLTGEHQEFKRDLENASIVVVKGTRCSSYIGVAVWISDLVKPLLSPIFLEYVVIK